MSHIPVLLDEVIRESGIAPNSVYVDGTLGAGGHAKALYLAAEKKITIIGFDKDTDALAIAKKNLESVGATPVYVHASFQDMKKELFERGYTHVDTIFLDLGLSSMHIDSAERGFTFLKDQPLHMNMNIEGDLRAADVVNSWGEETLVTILKGFGEERYAKSIARAIVAYREKQEIKTTYELVDIIKSAVPSMYRHGKIHPATKTFQAIRIAVNNELVEIETVITDAVSLLKENGRLLIITFHSLEDRIVKHQFKKLQDDNLGRIITKKPLIPTTDEVRANPRSRSAKLRIFQRV